MAPTVSQVAAACHGEVIAGDPELLGREALQLTVAAMTLPNLMERITDGAVLITPGDRADVLLAAMFAHASTALPSPAASCSPAACARPISSSSPSAASRGCRRSFSARTTPTTRSRSRARMKA